MKTHTQYDYFLAAYREEVDRRWAGHRKALADAAEISRGYLSEIYHAKKQASMELQLRLAAAFGRTHDELVARGRVLLEGTDPPDAAGVDMPLLRQVIERLEAELARTGVDLDPVRKAAAIVMIYRRHAGSKTTLENDARHVAELVADPAGDDA